MPSRTAEIQRRTRETDVLIKLDLDGSGRSVASTGLGFLDHMLDLLASHALFDLEVTCKGDLHVDGHHSAEDVGICLGMALDRAVGDKVGLRRYGHFVLPMDEALVTVALDLGGRPHFAWEAPMPTPRVGDFDSELTAEFWRAVAIHARMNFHVLLHRGSNTHHVIEAIFKAAARSLRTACEVDPRRQGVPSTKGAL